MVSASLLVTGNTVGSSMFVLPEAVKSVGMAWGSVIFVGEYCLLFVSLAVGLVFGYITHEQLVTSFIATIPLPPRNLSI